MIQTPAGINPGQSFIVVFVDSIGGDATSSDITTYNTAVQSAATALTYAGTIGTWQIAGATPTNDPAAQLFSSPLPVYDVIGHLLAPTGIAYGTSQQTLATYDQEGTDRTMTFVWTGLSRTPVDGGLVGFELGGATGTTSAGRVGNNLGFGWFTDSYPQGGGFFYYGFATLTAPSATAVPEPSSITLALVGLVGAAVACLARRRQAAASRPSGCLPARS